MKKTKRSIIAFAVLAFVCAAVYLNWMYNNEESDVNADATAAETEENIVQQVDLPVEGDGEETEDAGLYYTPDEKDVTVAEYFANVRLNRSQARDTAVQTLATVSETEGASQETVDSALAEIAQVAEYTILEAELEGLILAKGFEECVVFINDDGIDVTVPAANEGLSTAAVARITDIVVTETDFKPENLTIIEVKQ